jgi:hypothetical protein
VLLKRDVLEGIRAGGVDLAFRRWPRPRVRPGTRMRTAVGVLEVLGVEPVSRSAISEEDARRAGAGSLGALLSQLDARGDGDIHRIELRWAGPDPRVDLRERAALSAEELGEVLRRLERLDKAARHGPWTTIVLELIRDRPAVRAAELAAALGRERQPFKRDVRKLKELGLTESLERGYRLSPRGRAVLERLKAEARVRR